MFAKPCGIVVQTKELFGSEGKSQVYAHVHNLLSNKVMEDIGQLLVNVLIRMKTTLHHMLSLFCRNIDRVEIRLALYFKHRRLYLFSRRRV